MYIRFSFNACLSIYDSIKDITWLADANYAKTSGYDADGKMNWTQAKSWTANLNYAGFDDWRLPTTSPAVTGVNDKYEQTGSEMGHLFFSDFGAKVVKTPYTRTTPEIYTTTFLNPDKVALFSNLQEYAYWSDTSFASATGLITGAWYFNTNTGIQGVVRKPLQTWNYALAVRSGDVFYTQPPHRKNWLTHSPYRKIKPGACFWQGSAYWQQPPDGGRISPNIEHLGSCVPRRCIRIAGIKSHPLVAVLK